MLSNLSFDRSRFILKKSYSLPIIIPRGCDNAVIFSLKTREVFDTKIFLWSPKKREFILNILFAWDEINNVFDQITKSKIYNSEFSEVYCLTIKNSFFREFDTIVDAIVYSRLLLELVIEKVNQTKITQMNYLTGYEYLESIDLYEFLSLDS